MAMITYNCNVLKPLPYLAHDSFHISVGFQKSKTCGERELANNVKLCVIV